MYLTEVRARTQPGYDLDLHLAVHAYFVFIKWKAWVHTMWWIMLPSQTLYSATGLVDAMYSEVWRYLDMLTGQSRDLNAKYLSPSKRFQSNNV